MAIFFPNFQTVFLECPLAAVLEPVYLIYKPALVVSSKHVDESWVPKFVREQQRYNLYVILISVNIVALKQIFFVRWWPNLVEKSNKVLQLPMDISRDDDRCLHFDYYCFLLQLRYHQVEEIFDFAH